MKIRIALFAPLLSLGLLSCGNDGVRNVTFSLSFNEASLAILREQATFVRLWFTHDGLNRSGTRFFRVEPEAAAPIAVSSNVFDWQFANNAGFPVTLDSNSVFRFQEDIPTNQNNLQFAIEFLQQRTVNGTTRFVVVAFTCSHSEANEPYSKEQLEANATIPLSVVFGRSCGNCPARDNITLSTELFNNCPG